MRIRGNFVRLACLRDWSAIYHFNFKHSARCDSDKITRYAVFTLSALDGQPLALRSQSRRESGHGLGQGPPHGRQQVGQRSCTGVRREGEDHFARRRDVEGRGARSHGCAEGRDYG